MNKRMGYVMLGIIVILLNGCFSTSSSKSSEEAFLTKQINTPAPANSTTEAATEIKPSEQVGERQVGQSPTPNVNAVPKGNSPKVSETPSSTPHNPQEGGDSQTGNPSGESTQAVIEKVKGKYNDQLSQLKGYFTGQLEQYLNQAAADHKHGQTNEAIYQTYSQKLAALEEDSQSKVNQLLLQMKNELTAEQQTTESVSELRASYYAEVDKAKQEFLDKVKAAFG
jgi:hypothetical protein